MNVSLFKRRPEAEPEPEADPPALIGEDRPSEIVIRLLDSGYLVSTKGPPSKSGFATTEHAFSTGEHLTRWLGKACP